MTLQPSRSDIAPYFDRLVADYRDYCVTVSRRAMALAIETASYLWWLCDHMEAQAVCDLGSGFTSYVLRRYATESGRDVTVASVDDNQQWLKETARFLTSKGLPTTGLCGPIRWLETSDRYDVILHDFSAGETREQWMWEAVDHLTDRGVVLFDDAQNQSHHRFMAGVARQSGMVLLDMYDQTVDEVGRFAAMAVR